MSRTTEDPRLAGINSLWPTGANATWFGRQCVHGITEGGDGTVRWASLKIILQGVHNFSLTFEISTVHKKIIHFFSHERVFLWTCRSFWDRKCLDLRGIQFPNFVTFLRMPDVLAPDCLKWQQLAFKDYENIICNTRYRFLQDIYLINNVNSMMNKFHELSS